MPRKHLLLLVLAGLWCPGCQQLGYLLHLIAPEEPTQSVDPEYKELPGHNLAVLIYADTSVQCDYPSVRVELSMVLCKELREKVKNLRVVDYRRTIRYQDENIYWDAMDKTKLGKVFEADHLLLVSLTEFTTREPGSINLYRGRISAEASLYKMDLPERQSRVWRAEDIRVVYPPQDPTGELVENDLQLRYETERQFAEKLAQKFYKHKAPKQ